MAHRLILNGPVNWSELTHFQTELFHFPEHQAATPTQITPEIQGQALSFSGLENGRYLLALAYHRESDYHSLYFELDTSDITQIDLDWQGSALQIQQMGLLNDTGEFVDMLIYADQKPCLTFAKAEHRVLLALAETLIFKAPTLTAMQTRQLLNEQIGDLGQHFAQLNRLWPYQLKQLLQPDLMAQTSAAWKACLQHFLINDLMLMDNEHLQVNLQEAIALSQQEDAVEQLLKDLEWNSDQQNWDGLDAFLHAIAGQQMLT